MTTFEILLQQIGLFVIYILAGVTLVRTKVLNRETLEPISKFVIKMALPVMIFINIIDGVNKEILTGSWSILLIAAGFYAVMFLVSFGMTKFFHLSENSRRNLSGDDAVRKYRIHGSPGDFQCFSGKWDSVRFCIYGL